MCHEAEEQHIPSPALPLAAFALRPGRALPDAWPLYLFLFRGVHGSFRLAELTSAALTLGVDAGRLHCEPATTAGSPAPTGSGRQPEVSSYGGDLGPDLFQWVAMPSAEVAAAVAARCSTVRSAHEVWGSACFPRGKALLATEADERADERWQWLADRVQTEAAPVDHEAMRAPLADESWRVDITSVGRKKPRTLAGKIDLMEKLDVLLAVNAAAYAHHFPPPYQAGPSYVCWVRALAHNVPTP